MGILQIFWNLVQDLFVIKEKKITIEMTVDLSLELKQIMIRVFLKISHLI